MSIRKILVFCFLALTSSCSAQTVNDLSWLSGHWSNGESEEHWSAPRGETLLGFHRKVVDGKTQFYEFLRIDGSSGKVIYWADPSGQRLTPFPLKNFSPQSVLFANPAHDSPKWIQYTLKNDALEVEVSDDADFSLKWTLQRVTAHPRQ